MQYIVIVAIFLAAFWFLRRYSSSQQAGAHLDHSRLFLEENGKKEGVITTASGLQYLVLEQGSGESNPSASSTVTVHYHGTLINGQVFDSSEERGEPATFPLNQVISGWTEGLQLMVEGDKYRFFIPSKLAYGNRNIGSIPGGSLLIFDVSLLKIES
ncbi:FKBP-type peptidyl-prolyl cis-trans isomerase [Aliagarivorans taiwanensis]|uniref:FKBP-type peptidyl-prolyl cis-trans isomerase n=1 Tax=Aliagarivorans taiwanensis TaxID=561966 RepID=UPI0003FD020E|nr:FKBP-type peptidyl-prolyl cis-trans isomerase [Aliagarivorans taiwanensis]